MGNQNKTCKICHSIEKIFQCSCCKEFNCYKCSNFPTVANNPETLSQIQLIGVCKVCLPKKTQLDWQSKWQVVGEQNVREIVFVHGGGSNRKMFLPHARQLAAKGWRCVLLDLPGHGSRFKESLNLQSCIEALSFVIQQACKSKDPILIGGSFGAYIIMEFLALNSEHCSKAVCLMAGQEIGQQRGLKASFGLWSLATINRILSPVTLSNQFIKLAARNNHLNFSSIIENIRAGMYFHSAQEQIQTLKSCNPQLSLKNAKNKIDILFINGQKDYRDSEIRYLKAAGTNSKLIVFQDADHFFSHDNRYMSRLIQEIVSFIDVFQE